MEWTRKYHPDRRNLKETDRINSSLHPNPVGGRAKPSERQTRLGNQKRLHSEHTSRTPEENTKRHLEPWCTEVPRKGGADLPDCCRRRELVGSTPQANLSLGTTGKTNFSAARDLPGELGTHRGRIPLGPGTSCVYQESHTRRTRPVAALCSQTPWERDLTAWSGGHSWGCRAEETTNTAHPCPHPWPKRKLYKASGFPWGRARSGRTAASETPPEPEGTDRISSSLHPNPMGGRAKPSERQTRLGNQKRLHSAHISDARGKHQTPSGTLVHGSSRKRRHRSSWLLPPQRARGQHPASELEPRDHR